MTIYALSTGPGLSGVAVIRISGPDTKEVIKKLVIKLIIFRSTLKIKLLQF